MDVTRLVASLNITDLQELKKACEARIEILADRNSVRIVKVPSKDNFSLYLEAIQTISSITGLGMAEARQAVDAVDAGADFWIVVPSEGAPLIRLRDVGVDVELK